MGANSDPIYSRASDVQVYGPIRAVAAVLYDGSGTIGTDVYTCFIPDATNGGFLQRLRFKYVAPATTTSVAAVIKVFICETTSGATTDADTVLFDEVAVPATGALTTTATNASYEIPFGFAIPAGYSVVAKITVAQSANCGWMVTAIAGKY